MDKKMLTLGICLMVITAGMINAQPPRGRNKGNFDSKEFRKMIARRNKMRSKRMQKKLNADDASWKIIEPRLNKVIQLRRNSGGRWSMAGPPMGMGMTQMIVSGDTNKNVKPKLSAVEQAHEDLKTLLKQKKPSSAQIKAQLKKLRTAREKQKQKLASAQQKLREVLSLKQEAQLVLSNTLD